jgi:plastocyanin
MVAGLALLGAGCADKSADSGPGTTSAGPAPTYDIPSGRLVDKTGEKTVEVSVVDNTFEPSYIEVSPGTKLVFHNNGRNDHNVTPVVEGRFQPITTPNFAPGKVGTITVTGDGDIAYYCTIHGTKKLNGQSGVIRIKG